MVTRKQGDCERCGREGVRLNAEGLCRTCRQIDREVERDVLMEKIEATEKAADLLSKLVAEMKDRGEARSLGKALSALLGQRLKALRAELRRA